MKQKICIGFWLGLGILTMSGCNRTADEELWPAGGVPLQVANVHIGSGLVTTRADQTLDKGTIGFFTKVSGTEKQKNVCYTYGTPYWKAANPSESILLEEGMEYCAYYPWHSDIAADQIPMTALPAVEERGLSYLSYQSATKGAVTLKLERAYCQLLLVITWNAPGSSDHITSVSLEKTGIPAAATLNAGTGEVKTTLTTNRLAQAVDIQKSSLDGENKTRISMIVCPMDLEKKATVSIVLSGKTLTVPLKTVGKIEKGKQYVINMTLNTQTLTFGSVAEKPDPDGWTDIPAQGGELKP